MKTPSHAAVARLLAAGAILGGSAALAQNVSADIPADPPEVETPDDLTLARNVQNKLLRAPRSPALDIGVKADDGVVTLTGVVASEDDRTSAEAVARTTSGVKEVRNRIIVREGDMDTDALTPDPRGTSWDPPRTTPTPVTPGAPSLPNSAPTLPPPLPQLDEE